MSELKVKVTSLEDELDDLRKEVKDKHEEMTQLRSDGETKEMTIQDLQAEIETYQQKQEVRSGCTGEKQDKNKSYRSMVKNS